MSLTIGCVPWQHFVNTVARLLLPVDGAHAACCEEMATAMANAEGAALKGLQMCIDTIMAEVTQKPKSFFLPPLYHYCGECYHLQQHMKMRGIKQHMRKQKTMTL
jgi:hypothetical protein